jgi:ABC-type glycerol-3-phosphate transport system substrate-binding protein
MMGRIILAAALAASLAACGGREGLKHAEGEGPPPVARGATEAATADELLTPSTQARPERNAELLRQSEERKDDPFDLPPQSDKRAP